MKKLLFLSFTIFSVNCYSQIVFEKGYYINNEDQKVDCLIKNIDWKNNPTEFSYKISENSEIITATIKSVKEFGVNNGSKYIRSSVKIDRSSNSFSEMSFDKNPIFVEEELFLKVLVEGKANLYYYESKQLKRFFYCRDNSNIEQLVFKNYKSSEYKIGTNNMFKNQLWTDLKCPDFTLNKIENLNYNRKELVSFFIEYNKCNNLEFTNFDTKQKENLFNLTIRPGLNYSTLSIQNSISNFKNTDFDNELTFRFGIETEFIMPFNKNKWAIIIEPTYQYFKSEVLLTQNVKVDYKSIELPIGLRHFFYLNSNSKIFINGSYIFEFERNSKIVYNNLSSIEITTSPNLGFGIGYKNNHYYPTKIKNQ